MKLTKLSTFFNPRWSGCPSNQILTEICSTYFASHLNYAAALLWKMQNFASFSDVYTKQCRKTIKQSVTSIALWWKSFLINSLYSIFRIFANPLRSIEWAEFGIYYNHHHHHHHHCRNESELSTFFNPRWSGCPANQNDNVRTTQFCSVGDQQSPELITSIVPWRNPDTWTIPTQTENVAVLFGLRAWFDCIALVTVWAVRAAHYKCTNWTELSREYVADTFHDEGYSTTESLRGLYSDHSTYTLRSWTWCSCREWTAWRPSMASPFRWTEGRGSCSRRRAFWCGRREVLDRRPDWHVTPRFSPRRSTPA